LGETISIGAQNPNLVGTTDELTPCSFWGHEFAENEVLNTKRMGNRAANVIEHPYHVKYLHSYIYELVQREGDSPNSTRVGLSLIPRVVNVLEALVADEKVDVHDMLAVLRLHSNFLAMPRLEARPAVWAKPVPWAPPEEGFKRGEVGVYAPGDPIFESDLASTFELDKDAMEPPRPEDQEYQFFHKFKIFHAFPHKQEVVTEPNERGKEAWIEHASFRAHIKKRLDDRILEILSPNRSAQQKDEL